MLTAVPSRPVVSTRDLERAVGDVFQLANRLPATLPDGETYKTAAMDYLQQAKRAMEQNDRQGVENAMRSLQGLRRDIEVTWRR